MDMLKKYFSKAFTAIDVKSAIVTVLIYAVAAFLGGIVFGLLGAIPVIGFVANILGWLFELYCTVGIILAILVFFKIVK